MMTKKDYVAIAKVISWHVADYATDDLQDTDHGLGPLIDSLAALFAADNPRFDRARFLTACGIKQG